MLVLIIIISMNVLSSFVFTRIDLTTEKRFTLSKATKDMMANLKDVVYVKVYLNGDLSSGFKKLSNATKELLDEMRVYSHGNLEYQFIDPSANADEKERNRLYLQLGKKGLQPTNIKEKSKEGSSQKIIFPGAIFSYLSKEIPL